MVASSKDATAIFLHIPKNGGTTLRDIITRQYGPSQLFVINNTRDPSYRAFCEFKENDKRKLKLVMGHFGFGIHEQLPQPARYFTLLRDPAERAISHYYYILRHPTHTHYRVITQENLDLAEFVQRGISKMSTDNGQIRLLGTHDTGGEDIPFGKVTRDSLECAKQNLREWFDVVGLVEQFDESMLLLQHTFHWTTPWYVTKNANLERNAPRAVAPATMQLLREMNTLDYELYEYGRTLYQAQLQAQPASFRVKLSAFRVLNERPQLRNAYFKLRAITPS